MKSLYGLTMILTAILLLAGCSSISSNPAPTQTFLPKNTPSTTPILVTPSPTTTPADAEAKVIELLKNNGDCRFPCFLGITPSQTKEQEAITFLHTFDSISPGIEILIPRDDLTVSLSVTTQGGYDATPEVIKWIDVDTTIYRKLEPKLEKDYDTPYYSNIFRYYTLPNLLTTYGTPENIYIFLDTGIEDMGLGIDLYILHLDYPKQGWVAHLEMPLLHKDGLFIGCPSEAFTKLRLWSPNDPSRDFTLDSSSLFSIEEATGLSVEEFYKKFKDPSTNACLETPANIHK